MNHTHFFSTYYDLLQRIEEIDAPDYARSRNFLDGNVTALSPFISHGILSTRQIASAVLTRYSRDASEKFLQELGWREYFQRVWQHQGDGIFTDLRLPQEKVSSRLVPIAIATGKTGIVAIDQAVEQLVRTGYMHNHARMWIASLTCNIAQTHWLEPARWMYYHLLDGDLASNSLNWQWNAGTFSNKKYYANQHNINTFSRTSQRDTILDVSYDEISTVPLPSGLNTRASLTLTNTFPQSIAAPLTAGSALLYSIWNLDPRWRPEFAGRRLLWIEPSKHQAFPLSPLRWQFIQHWAAQIPGLELFVGEPIDLFPQGVEHLSLMYREHPTCHNWPGTCDVRDWMCPLTTGSFSSFFAFWKKARKELAQPVHI
jgi:deoxyribodipyrimidine photo-lyase